MGINPSAIDLNEYIRLKNELIGTLTEKVDGNLWILIDYPSNSNIRSVGIYTYGDLSPACKIIRMFLDGNEECEKSHKELITMVNENGKAQALSCCWANMKYITCRVTVGEVRRILLIGQRLGEITAVKAASAATDRLKTKESFIRELGKVYRENGNPLIAFRNKLEEAFKEVKPMCSETEEKTKQIVNEYKEKIEKANLKVDFRELDMYGEVLNDSFQLQKGIRAHVNYCKWSLEKAKYPIIRENIKSEVDTWEPVSLGGPSDPINRDDYDPFEISLDSIDKLSRKALFKLHNRVFQKNRSFIENEFDKDENISELICYREGGVVKFEYVKEGKDFSTIRKELQERLDKYCYVFSRPVIQEEVSLWSPIGKLTPGTGSPYYDYYPSVEVFVANPSTENNTVFEEKRKVIGDFDTGAAMFEKATGLGKKTTCFQFPEELAHELSIAWGLTDPDTFFITVRKKERKFYSLACRKECKIGLRTEKANKVVKVLVRFIETTCWNEMNKDYNPNRKAFITRDLFYFFEEFMILLDPKLKKTTILP